MIPEVQSIFGHNEYVRARKQPKLYLEELKTDSEHEYHRESARLHSKQGDLKACNQKTRSAGGTGIWNGKPK